MLHNPFGSISGRRSNFRVSQKMFLIELDVNGFAKSLHWIDQQFTRSSREGGKCWSFQRLCETRHNKFYLELFFGTPCGWGGPGLKYNWKMDFSRYNFISSLKNMHMDYQICYHVIYHFWCYIFNAFQDMWRTLTSEELIIGAAQIHELARNQLQIGILHK